MQDNLGCLDLVLSPAQLQRLNEVSQIELGFLHDFLSRDTIRDRLFSGTFDTIDNPHNDRWHLNSHAIVCIFAQSVHWRDPSLNLFVAVFSEKVIQ